MVGFSGVCHFIAHPSICIPGYFIDPSALILVQQNVTRLQVPMQDAALVGMMGGLRQDFHKGGRLAHRLNMAGENGKGGGGVPPKLTEPRFVSSVGGGIPLVGNFRRQS